MKALEKDRSRRYETANGFAADVQRYLNGEAVARPPAERGLPAEEVRPSQPGQVIAASLVLAALVAGVVGTSVGLVARRQARSPATRRSGEGESTGSESRGAAGGRAEPGVRQEGERDPRLGVRRPGPEGGITPPSPSFATPCGTTWPEAVKELDGSAIGDPLEVAAMQNTLGRSLLGLGEANLAIDVFGKSLATRTAKLGDRPPRHPRIP